MRADSIIASASCRPFMACSRLAVSDSTPGLRTSRNHLILLAMLHKSYRYIPATECYLVSWFPMNPIFLRGYLVISAALFVAAHNH